MAICARGNEDRTGRFCRQGSSEAYTADSRALLETIGGFFGWRGVRKLLNFIQQDAFEGLAHSCRGSLRPSHDVFFEQECYVHFFMLIACSKVGEITVVLQKWDGLSALRIILTLTWGCAPGWDDVAPLALFRKGYCTTGRMSLDSWPGTEYMEMVAGL